MATSYYDYTKRPATRTTDGRGGIGTTGQDTGSGGPPGPAGDPPGPYGGTGTPGTGLNIMGANPRPVVGASDLQKYAGSLVPGLVSPTLGESMATSLYGQMPWLSQRQATGAGIATDPAVQNSVEAFKTFGAPIIQNRNSLMGLGRSNATTKDLGLGLQQFMTPAIQDALAREESSINRAVQGYGAAASGLSGLGSQETARKTNAINTAMSVGGTQRGIAQEQAQAPYEDFLRRAALGENVLMGPFGGLVPSTIGSSSTTNGK